MPHNKMLIDATHPEETRVVVLRDGRVEEFDYESAARKLLRGNIYLAKVTRVEPSLQAAFIDYGGNRHGFLAFNEIHPDYYQIPFADRQALIDEEAAAEAAEEAAADAHAERLARRRRRPNGRGGQQQGSGRDRSQHGRHRSDGDEDAVGDIEPYVVEVEDESGGEVSEAGADAPVVMAERSFSNDDVLVEELPDHEPSEPEVIGEFIQPLESRDHDADSSLDETGGGAEELPQYESGDELDLTPAPSSSAHEGNFEHQAAPATEVDHEDGVSDASDAERTDDAPRARRTPSTDPDEQPNCNGDAEAEAVDETGAEDALEELPSRPRRRPRSYKIQEVIKRRQVVLVQVVKEERGNKGAALTTYLSLAGRYTVLMPNTARGGGISRKITNPQDRKRLKAIAADLEVPEGMGLIIRTAGAARTQQEIKRDFEYLLRLWESVRELTLQSTAPSLVYEEGDLIKRSIRDLYNKDVEEIVVAGEPAHREAQDFMRMLMPSHAKNVVLHGSPEPLFTRYGIERQLNAMFSPFVTLRSGGYLVINQTEALVAIDVNSGKSTREFSIEETALNTNLEAADEIARQLKLRDLAGLVVIDFIDMEEKRNNRAVERRIKDALRFDRARIQIGHISHFGLLEMSRQRLRTGVLEGSTSQCPHCQGTGIIRSTESVALAVLRGIEDALMAGAPTSLTATTTAAVALYILNNKRRYIQDMEAHHGISITVQASEKLQGANFTVEKGPHRADAPRRIERSAVNMDWGFDGDEELGSGGVEEIVELDEAPRSRDRDRLREAPRPHSAAADDVDGESEGEDGGRSRRRRRRRGNERGGREGGHPNEMRGPRDGRERDRPNGHRNPAIEAVIEERGPRDEDELRPDREILADDALGDEAGDDLDIPGTGDQPDIGADSESAERRRRRRRGRRGGRRGRGRERDETTMGSEADGHTAIGAGHVTEEFVDDFAGPARSAGSEQETVGLVGELELSGEQPASEDPMMEQQAPTRRPRRDSAPIIAPLPETLVQSAETAEPPVYQQPAPEPEVEPQPIRKARHEPTVGEPRLERVVVTPDQAASELAGETSDKPTKKGWWQRRLGG